MHTSIKRALALYVFSLVFTLPALADICDPSPRPAATLLFPYFEVDLDDPAGRTTLISINNADDEPTVARLTLWSNLGLPTLGFDILLDVADVQTINLRNLLAGEIPETRLETLPAGCSDPLILPALDGEDVEDLRAWHMGLPGRDDLCRGIAVEDTGLAVGYVTVDAMNQCAPFTTFPGDSTIHPGDLRYFEDGGNGLASNENILWGDLILIDPAGDAAQAVAAQHVRADGERFSGPVRTFYGFGDDDRATLPATYRGRFLQGQPAETETSFLLWIDPYALGSFPRAGSPVARREPT